MASSTPPPCTITSTKPYQNQPVIQNHHRHHHHQTHRGYSHKVYVATSSPSLRNTAKPGFPSPSTSELSCDFSGRRSTRFVSKMHLGRPKTAMSSRHTSVAEEVLQQVIRFVRDDAALESVLLSFESKLSGSEDYSFLLRELGNRGECSMAIRCFEFAIQRERRRNEQGKLATAMIGTLGRLGRVDLAKSVFDTANVQGYGNTVYAFSALISAYGRSGLCEEAIKVFESMKQSGLKPNLVTYNALIDAYAKGGVVFYQAMRLFDEMVANGVQPDRITFNSLLSVCSRGGLWQVAMNMFDDMAFRGIDRDIFTYNTLLDAVCKGGQMDLAYEIMSDIYKSNVLPNVVTYSTLIDGYAKVGRLDEALSLFKEMKLLGIGLDRVSYNTLLSIYAKLGRFEEALAVCKEMQMSGIKKDAVTYNALLVGYGKQGNYEELQKLFEEMKVEGISPNVLTYSTLIDAYSKGGMYKEAMKIFKEFKQAGLKADVVLYSALVDALCKNGLVESAVCLLEEMMREGIRPNVVTYNSIIDAFGRSANSKFEEGETEEMNGSKPKQLDNAGIEGGSEIMGEHIEGNNKFLKILGKLTDEKGYHSKEDLNGKSEETLCILGILHKMHELEIKPNVVTFSAILSSCSRCHSFEDASTLLEELRLFDNQVYGVAHRLLMGCREEVWVQAQSLFDEVKRMDSSTATAFYNALADMLWHFGQKQGAQSVVLEGRRRHVWENMWLDSCLDLHLMSSGAAQAILHAWLLNIRSIVFEGHELPKLVSILTGWGKHSKVAGEGTLRVVIGGLLRGIGAPFHVAKCNIGRFVSTGPVVAAWLRQSQTLKVLILHDDRKMESGRLSNLQILPL